uniref:CTXD1 protein n=1 Tax=Taeniopygia guttata TaxID=59729 RepID=A0A674HK82_TAEGU
PEGPWNTPEGPCMETPTVLPTMDVDKAVATAFVVLLGLFLLAMTVRCARLVVDPYSAIPTSTWEEEPIN